MPNIKDVGIEFTFVADNDLIPVQRGSDNLTGRAKKSTIVAGLSSGNNTNPRLDRVLQRDSNWILSTRGNTASERQSICWTSFNTAESNTGKLRLGYLLLNTQIHCLFAGGGATNGNLKLIKLFKRSDNSLLLSTNLNSVMGSNQDNFTYCTINTSSIAGNEVYLELEDTDSNSGWAWFAFCPDVFIQ